jgi:hypothetical protein
MEEKPVVFKLIRLSLEVKVGDGIFVTNIANKLSFKLENILYVGERMMNRFYQLVLSCLTFNYFKIY